LHIHQILNNNNIKYISQYTNPELRTEQNGNLRFDFAILNENNEVIRLIEFDGIQHTNTNNYFNDFALFERDERKNQYAKEKGIPLVRIPYYKRDTLILEDLFGDQFII
jgi:hypothetical protein